MEAIPLWSGGRLLLDHLLVVVKAARGADARHPGLGAMAIEAAGAHEAMIVDALQPKCFTLLDKRRE